MSTIQNYITALWLIAYIPKMAYLYVCENWRMLVCAITVVLGLFALSYHLGKDSGGTSATAASASAAYDGGGFGFVDLTAAFATGEKRSMQVELVAIHHTAGRADGTVNDICRVHFGEHKWSGVGYHLFIEQDGTTYQLRPLDERVPHAYGCNDNAIAICLAGNFSQYEPTDAQRTSALQLCRWLMKKYGLTADKVKAHRELTNYSPQNATDCCGIKFNIQKFRNEL